MMTQDTNDNNPKQGHYFSESPTAPSQRHRFTIWGPNGDLTVFGESGVFSQHGVDKGTAVLLDALRKHEVPTPQPGSSLCDLGCGSGVIALTLAALFPQCTVYAIDVNERARALCAENAKTNKLSNVVVCSPEACDPSLRFSLMWSNPPIRIGKAELHTLLTTWLSRLDEDGTAHLVVNKNLGADSLSQWLQQQSYSTKRLGSSKGFRVLEVTAK